MLEGRQRIRVEWAHCDPARIIFNPHYYIWMDQGTQSLIQAAGFDQVEAVRTTPFRGCALVRSEAEFITPAFYRDVLELRSRVERFGNKSFKMSHEFWRAETLVARGHEIRVWGWSDPTDPERLTAIPVPDTIRELLSRNGIVDTNV